MNNEDYIYSMNAEARAELNEFLRKEYGIEVREMSGRLWMGLAGEGGGLLLHSDKTVADAVAFGKAVSKYKPKPKPKK